MSAPNRKDPAELVKDLLWQNHSLTQLNLEAVTAAKKMADENFKLKEAALEKKAAEVKRPSIVR